MKLLVDRILQHQIGFFCDSVVERIRPPSLATSEFDSRVTVFTGPQYAEDHYDTYAHMESQTEREDARNEHYHIQNLVFVNVVL